MIITGNKCVTIIQQLGIQQEYNGLNPIRALCTTIIIVVPRSLPDFSPFQLLVLS